MAAPSDLPRSAILFTCDHGFLHSALFAAWQVRQMLSLQSPPPQIDIVIASADDLSGPVRAAGYVFQPIEVDGFINALPAHERIKHYTYWRLPALEVLSQAYDRILYLDTDVLAASPDIVDLFDLPLHGQVLGAVRDVHQRHRSTRMPREFAALNLPVAPYFNGGVLLVDGRAWQAQGVFDRIKTTAKDHGAALFCHDQSLLNLVFRNAWAELSPVWNWQYSYRVGLLTLTVGAILVHLAGRGKLWNAPGDIPEDLPRDLCQMVPRARHPAAALPPPRRQSFAAQSAEKSVVCKADLGRSGPVSGSF